MDFATRSGTHSLQPTQSPGPVKLVLGFDIAFSLHPELDAVDRCLPDGPSAGNYRQRVTPRTLPSDASIVDRSDPVSTVVRRLKGGSHILL